MSKDLAAELEQIAAALKARPLAKTSVSFRERCRSKAHAAFAAGIEALLLDGWTMRRIAQHMEVDPVTLKDWYEQGDTKRAQIPYWATAALPLVGRAAAMRVELSWSDPPPASARTGTDG